LDYTKKNTQSKVYNSTASRYFAEYNLHMYGWFWTGWSLDKAIPLISEAALSAKEASVEADKKDEDWYVNLGTAILAFLGF